MTGPRRTPATLVRDSDRWLCVCHDKDELERSFAVASPYPRFGEDHPAKGGAKRKLGPARLRRRARARRRGY